VSSPTGSPLTTLAQRLLPRLRYPQLFLALAVLLLVNLVLPDPVPLIDELLLATLTVITASLRHRREEPPPRDVTPPDDELRDPPSLPR
jgi:hypothetical protein